MIDIDYNIFGNMIYVKTVLGFYHISTRRVHRIPAMSSHYRVILCSGCGYKTPKLFIVGGNSQQLGENGSTLDMEEESVTLETEEDRSTLETEDDSAKLDVEMEELVCHEPYKG